MNHEKYSRFKKITMKNRKWPDNEIIKSPIWCSVDLRDGNQALPNPMNVDEKIKMFNMLVSIGFKEIEVGFPSASDTEYKFLRKLIDENLIPQDVTIQVLTQAREHLILKTFEALKGCKKAIVHIYNSTSTLQRNIVFDKTKEEIIEIAVKGARLVKDEAEKYPETKFIFEYSPESFTGTELDYAVEICEKVLDVWNPTPNNKVILNLPSTVEMATPNIYADQIEWFCENLTKRDSVIISLHTHNDRGTSTASSELGLLAGADRLEGTLFGNGERTGNMDIVNVAMNLYSQGIDPKLDFSQINSIIKTYEECTKLRVHERHPYAGELVYCAFSGSHQDAIRKGMIARNKSNAKNWEVPYLPIDPHDLGREYKEIIRINSQSGKGGSIYIMENDFGYMIPKNMHKNFGNVIKRESDLLGRELTSEEIFNIFEEEYMNLNQPYKIKKYRVDSCDDNEKVSISAIISYKGIDEHIRGVGNGPIDSFSNAIRRYKNNDYKFVSYWEHALDEGSHSSGVAYVQIQVNGNDYFGVSVSENINTAAINALLNAINKSYEIENKGENEYGNDYDSKDIIETY
ncbi:2-isopropylmalate synthase [Romboutsia sp. CE17]|uniref:2-isopropylmalate synthase n=1 Tax=Romboutsia sp. CE17 TaxID=2724150 RepID=UPI001442ADC9|nr:2-isopropylmalate synthase [Romboutsia sp. CE17]QJA07838.1 2-isopropylmalate synthase [Romboutsia sp. CE17]